MAKLLKIAGNSIHTLLEIVLILVICFAFLIRTAPFQTFLAHKATEILSDFLDTKVSIGKVDIAFFDRIYISDLYVEDHHEDTLLYAQEFFVNYSLKKQGFTSNHFVFDEVQLKRVDFFLMNYKEEEFSNLNYILNKLKSDKKKEKKSDFEIDVKRFKLLDAHFVYLDENKKKLESTEVIDFKDLDVTKIYIDAKNVNVTKDNYYANFNKISLQDKSGFILANLSGKANYSNKGLQMTELNLNTPTSFISMNYFNMNMDSPKDYKDFVDKVKLESEINNSVIDMRDIMHFTSSIKGMDNRVAFSGSTKNTISDFAMEDMVISYGNGTVIEGDFNLPDFRQLSKEHFSQKFKHLKVNVADLTSFGFPGTSPNNKIKWPSSLKALSQIEVYDLSIEGSLENLQIDLSDLYTNIGKLSIEDELKIKMDTTFTSFQFIPKSNQKEYLTVTDFALGNLIESKDFRMINGTFGFNQFVVDKKGVRVDGVNGLLNNTYLYGYSYDYIILDNIDYALVNGKNSQNILDGKLYVRDDNLDLSYDGYFNLGKEMEMDANIFIECAELSMLHPKFEKRGELIATMDVDLKGESLDKFRGNISIDSLFYQEDGRELSTKEFRGLIVHEPNNDSITIHSDMLNAHIAGVLDYNNVIDNIEYQVTRVFPSLKLTLPDVVVDSLTYFDYDIKVKNINPLLSVVYPSLEIANNTLIEGSYDGRNNAFGMMLTSDYININTVQLSNIFSTQEIYNQELMSLVHVEGLSLNDSLSFESLHFTGMAYNGFLDAQFSFDDLFQNKSNLSWLTDLNREDGFELEINPSYIFLNEQKWSIFQNTYAMYEDGCLYLDLLKLERKGQSIEAKGYLSDYPKDKMNIEVKNFDLEDINDFLPENNAFYGIVNATGYITTPLNNLNYFGEAIIRDFTVNETVVGDVSFGADYSADEDQVMLYGDIYSLSNRTFRFDGGYYVRNVPEDNGNLDLNMEFTATDISVAKEFLSKGVLKKLEGKLNGKAHVTGTIVEPILTGNIAIKEGLVNMDLLGTDMFFEGEIEMNRDGIYINQMPIKDVEGNEGYIVGSLFHNYFKDFYFEVVINLEDHPTKRMPDDPSKPLPVERFLAMDTKYEMGSLYYGKAYVTGNTVISGALDDLRIRVNVKTRKGTKMALPMFGPTTIEEDGFITFKKAVDEEETHSMDLSGIDLDMNIEVTEDAEVKIIFDEVSGDEITAKGAGQIGISVDRFGELAINGAYTVASGDYNFVMGPYKQKFLVESGGTVQWAGDPYDAILNLNAYYKTMANLSVVMPDILDERQSTYEEIYSNINITGSLTDPEISFDIEAPKASEAGKAVISRIRSDRDELNKQFFAIVITKSFMPLVGQGNNIAQGGGALLDLASTQINSILNQFSDDYRLNVNLENDEYSGEFSGELGISKEFLDGRLIMSGSLGVGTKTGNNGEEGIPNQSRLLGDVKIEYLLNESGTFRINVFNESNNNAVIQNEGRGQFIQGVGVSYKEDFFTMRDFKLLQFFGNLFRKKENRIDIYERNKRKTPIPQNYLNKNAIKDD